MYVCMIFKMAANDLSSFQSVHKSYYKCCKNKEINHFICVKCYGIFHKSCALRSNKNFRFINENHLICCEQVNSEKSDDTSAYETRIKDLTNENELKENYIKKLKCNNQSFTEEAIKNEEELSEKIKHQQVEISELKKLIVDLRKQIKTELNGNKDIRTNSTQTIEKNVNTSVKPINTEMYNTPIPMNTGCINITTVAPSQIKDNYKILEIETSYLKQLINQKDIIINKLEDSVTSLKDQIGLLNSIAIINKVHTSTANVLVPMANNNISKSVSVPNKAGCVNMANSSNTNIMRNQLEISNIPPISKQSICTVKHGTGVKTSSAQIISNKTVSDAILDAETRLKCQEIITLNDNNEATEGSFKNVVYKKRKKNPPIVGEMECNNTFNIKSLPKLAFLHVYKVHPDTTTDELKELLKPTFPEVIVETMKSMYPQYYASFKVTIEENNVSKAMTPSVWPRGAHVNKFFHPRRILPPKS